MVSKIVDALRRLIAGIDYEGELRRVAGGAGKAGAANEVETPRRDHSGTTVSVTRPPSWLAIAGR